ncbi:hypothetical protein LD39_11225 [Halobacillus sp. BBL2006]|nr:hypothetical protein LD39_11225 [Halobacillus sp. BBL2006]
MLETVTAFSVFLLIVLTIYPSLIQLRAAQREFALERYAISALQDQFQSLPERSNSYPYSISDETHTQVTFLFQQNEEFIEGCASWRTREGNLKEFCMYELQK